MAISERRTIKTLVLNYVKECEGHVDYDELTRRVRQEFPSSQWQKTHWAWYRSQILHGRFRTMFSEAALTALAETQQIKKARVARATIKTVAVSDRRTIRALVLDHVKECEGQVDYEELTRLVRQHFPSSKWKMTHWAWYRNEILNGQFRTMFSESVLKTLAKTLRFQKHRSSRAGSTGGAPGMSRTRNRLSWPEWPVPGEEAILMLAHELAPFIRFLHPDIVAAVAEDNERRRNAWCPQLQECGVDPKVYLWERSPCAFPGVRRFAGSREVAQYRGHTGDQNSQPLNALRLDDNDFPKQIWSFVFRGKPFQKFGPAGYSLAHMADHKDHNNRCESEFESPDGTNMPECFFGLYTSAANAVYVPTNFIKPTDFNNTLRTLLQRKAQQLYGGLCNLVPPPLRVKAVPSPQWELEQFRWGEPVASTTYIQDFLEYRARTINDLLTQRRPQAGQTSGQVKHS